MKKAGDDATFLVSGYIGSGRSKDDYFEGYCIACDKGAAIELKAQTIPMLNPLGVTSLAEMKRYVAVLEKVAAGALPAPGAKGFKGHDNG